MKPWKKGDWKAMCYSCGGNSSGAVYGLGFVGALIYFLQHATTVWEGLFGVVKAVVWPAILIYRVLDLLRM